MLEPSLIFFYCFAAFFIVVPIFRLIKPPKKKDDFLGLLFVVFFAVALGYLLDSKNPIPSILKVVSVIFVIFFIFAVINYLKDKVIIKKAISSAVSKIKSDIDYDMADIFSLKGRFFHRKKWYIVLCPEENIILIGINEYGQAPYLNKYFHLHTINGQHIDFSKLFSSKSDVKDKVFFVGPLKEFYSSDEENKKIVDDYILRIKNESF